MLFRSVLFKPKMSDTINTQSPFVTAGQSERTRVYSQSSDSPSVTPRLKLIMRSQPELKRSHFPAHHFTAQISESWFRVNASNSWNVQPLLLSLNTGDEK